MMKENDILTIKTLRNMAQVEVPNDPVALSGYTRLMCSKDMLQTVNMEKTWPRVRQILTQSVDAFEEEYADCFGDICNAVAMDANQDLYECEDFLEAMRPKALEWLRSGAFPEASHLVSLGAAYRLYDLNEPSEMSKLVETHCLEMGTAVSADEAVKLAMMFGA